VKNWYYIWKKSEFHDQKGQAANHLDKLTGQIPKRFERPHKYLQKVLIAEDGSVPVKIAGGSGKKVEKAE
jgi:hypothetical protein